MRTRRGWVTGIAIIAFGLVSVGMAAAQAKDHDKTFDAGGEIYNACYNCHGKYIPRPKNSLYNQGVENAVPPR